MKKLFFISFVAVTIFVTGWYQLSYAQTGSELLDKAIAFYDPQNKWADFSGKVQLMTAWPDGRNSGGEIIEIHTRDGGYQCKRIASGTIRGVQNNECFLIENGERVSPSEECEDIKNMRSWHHFHLGMLMELKSSGLVLDETVGKENFRGEDCLTLRFTYDPAKIKNDYYRETNWVFYVNPVNYTMRGYKMTGRYNGYTVFSGILPVNGLMIPMCKTYYNLDDNSFRMVDLFTSVADN